ncbi:MAG: hypothetical protein JNL53_01505 [Cyclobacteriaceae bacterium]|nr:hypothetical protein [Cyclobacteriaceae bacterium]
MKKFRRQENFLKKYVGTEFEERLLKSSFQNLQDFKNDLCFNNFAYSIQELSRHILARLSPDKDVLMTTWYKNEIPYSLCDYATCFSLNEENEICDYYDKRWQSYDPAMPPSSGN